MCQSIDIGENQILKAEMRGIFILRYRLKAVDLLKYLVIQNPTGPIDCNLKYTIYISLRSLHFKALTLCKYQPIRSELPKIYLTVSFMISHFYIRHLKSQNLSSSPFGQST